MTLILIISPLLLFWNRIRRGVQMKLGAPSPQTMPPVNPEEIQLTPENSSTNDRFFHTMIWRQMQTHFLDMPGRMSR